MRILHTGSDLFLAGIRYSWNLPDDLGRNGLRYHRLSYRGGQWLIARIT